MSDNIGSPKWDNHYVNEAPFEPEKIKQLSPEQLRVYEASQWRMMWWRFRRHKLAVISAAFLLAAYISILACEFLAPYTLDARNISNIHQPPQSVHFFYQGEFIGPFVYEQKYRLNMANLQREYTPLLDQPRPIRFFCSGLPYKWFGLELNRHLFCPAENGTLFLMGTDRLGRDILSRVIYGARISLTVGLIGITVSFVVGLTLGGLAGYFGGWIDSIVQRMIEVVRSFPELPLWMALSAALPNSWGPIAIFAAISVIFGLVDWTGLARAVRSKLLSLREEDFCTAAILLGAKPRRIITRHLLPNFFSHLIASATLAIPAMILGETALSFLGLGLRPPITSWGVLLVEAQNINAVAIYPWLMFPVLPVVLVVLAFNFLGDGLRDAADPY